MSSNLTLITIFFLPTITIHSGPNNQQSISQRRQAKPASLSLCNNLPSRSRALGCRLVAHQDTDPECRPPNQTPFPTFLAQIIKAISSPDKHPHIFQHDGTEAIAALGTYSDITRRNSPTHLRIPTYGQSVGRLFGLRTVPANSRASVIPRY